MANKLQKMINGKVIEVTDEIMNVVQRLEDTNTRLERQLQAVSSRLDDISETTEEISVIVSESKEKHYIGKKPEFIHTVIDEVKIMASVEKRKVLHKAAGRQPSGYNRIYAKLVDITGVDIYGIGKLTISKKDGFGKTYPQESYINTIFLKGVEDEAAAIALDMIRNK